MPKLKKQRISVKIMPIAWVLRPQYAYPYWRNAHIRYNWTVREYPFDDVFNPKGALNKFWHAKALWSADIRQGGSGNNDTLYSMAFVHVDKEPMVLTDA